jgi:hypothetical protein
VGQAVESTLEAIDVTALEAAGQGARAYTLLRSICGREIAMALHGALEEIRPRHALNLPFR